MTTNVLVTGVGAIIGYGIVRSLRKANRDLNIVGTDIYPDAVGQAWCDTFERAPYTSAPHYVDWLKGVLDKHRVELLFPGIEQDVHFLSDNRDLFQKIPVEVVLNNPDLINLTRDKWTTHQELLRIGSNARIPSYIEGDFRTLSSKLGLPFILKPRCSYASKGLVRIESEKEFLVQAPRIGRDLIAQPLIGSDDEEYTISVFGDGTGRACASISLRRRLAADGSTAKAWVHQNIALSETVAQLCRRFQPIGPTNLQFRREGNDWKLLEINPRISSTTSIRSSFGYNESLMCLQFYIDGREIQQPPIQSGFAVRYIEDVIVYDRDHF